jgi:hypothetical protein
MCSWGMLYILACDFVLLIWYCVLKAGRYCEVINAFVIVPVYMKFECAMEVL